VLALRISIWVIALALIAVLAAPTALAGRNPGVEAPGEASTLLPAPEELPAGFSRQPQYDRNLEEPGVRRAIRFYTRDDPESATDAHASILVEVAISDSPDAAAGEFHETSASWERMGYDLAPLGLVGDEAMSGVSMFFRETNHLKEGALVEFRSGLVTATVQYIDNPGSGAQDGALSVARLIEERAVARDPSRVTSAESAE
jgi:hypothetical protein